MTLSAIVFDFDGLILDTEWSVYTAIAEIYIEHGFELDLDWWRSMVGTPEGVDWTEQLEALVGTPLDHDYLFNRSSHRHHELVDAMEPMPGVVDLIEAAHLEGLRLAVASSSMTGWLDRNLTRVGLYHRFDALCGRDRAGGRGKPAPDVYLAALADIGVAAPEAVAIEDSPHGVSAAKAAGLRCIAVPNRITAPGDFSEADLVVDSVAALTLAELHARFG